MGRVQTLKQQIITNPYIPDLFDYTEACFNKGCLITFQICDNKPQQRLFHRDYTEDQFHHPIPSKGAKMVTKKVEKPLKYQGSTSILNIIYLPSK